MCSSDLAVEQAFSELTDQHLDHTVVIRGTPCLVREALARLSCHAAYHVGQIVLLSRMFGEKEWKWLSIPKKK